MYICDVWLHERPKEVVSILLVIIYFTRWWSCTSIKLAALSIRTKQNKKQNCSITSSKPRCYLMKFHSHQLNMTIQRIIAMNAVGNKNHEMMMNDWENWRRQNRINSKSKLIISWCQRTERPRNESLHHLELVIVVLAISWVKNGLANSVNFEPKLDGTLSDRIFKRRSFELCYSIALSSEEWKIILTRMC